MSDIAPPDYFGKSGPLAKTRAQSRANPPEEALSIFLNTGPHLHALRKAQFPPAQWKSVPNTVPPVAIWSGPLISICSRRTSFDGVLASTQEVLAPFAYPPMSMAGRFLNLPPPWSAPAVRGVERVLESARDLSLKFDRDAPEKLFRKLTHRQSPPPISGLILDGLRFRYPLTIGGDSVA